MKGQLILCFDCLAIAGISCTHYSVRAKHVKWNRKCVSVYMVNRRIWHVVVAVVQFAWTDSLRNGWKHSSLFTPLHIVWHLLLHLLRSAQTHRFILRFKSNIHNIYVCVCDCIRVSCRIQNRSTVRLRSWRKRDIRSDHRRSVIRVACFTQFFVNYLTSLRCKTAQSPIWFEKKYASQSPDWSGKLWKFTLWITFQFMRKLWISMKSTTKHVLAKTVRVSVPCAPAYFVLLLHTLTLICLRRTYFYGNNIDDKYLHVTQSYIVQGCRIEDERKITHGEMPQHIDSLESVISFAPVCSRVCALA